MATINQKQNGHWKATVRKRRYGLPLAVKTFRRKEDAEAWARKTESEAERGVWRDTSEAERLALRDALDRYRRECTSKKKGKIQEESTIRALVAERIGGMTLARIGSADLARMVSAWQRIPLAPATIKRRLAVLSAVYTHARKSWGMPALTNPVRDTETATVHNNRERRVTDAEMNAVLAASASPELGAFVRLAVATAMRRGEIVGLRWLDVDTARSVAHLHDTKNGEARDVPLSPAALGVLRKKPRRIDGRVFGLRADAVTLAWRRAVARARKRYVEDCTDAGQEPDPHFLVDLRVHDLRHEATSRLAEIFGPHELAKITGHRDMRMLLRYYHPRAEDLAKRMAARAA